MSISVCDQSWWHVSAIADELGTTVDAVTADIRNGVYPNARCENGEWLVLREEVERVFFASLTPEQFSAPMRQPRRYPAEVPEMWQCRAIPPVCRYRQATYVSFRESARRLATTYQDIYARAMGGEFQTHRVIHELNEHWYVALREVQWFENRMFDQKGDL